MCHVFNSLSCDSSKTTKRWWESLHSTPAAKKTGTPTSLYVSRNLSVLSQQRCWSLRKTLTVGGSIKMKMRVKEITLIGCCILPRTMTSGSVGSTKADGVIFHKENIIWLFSWMKPTQRCFYLTLTASSLNDRSYLCLHITGILHEPLEDIQLWKLDHRHT